MRNTLLLMTLLGYSTFALAGGRTPLSTTAVGHMCVTLLTPAALTQSQTLEFKNISSSKESTAFTTQEGVIKVGGNNSAYSVTVSANSLGINNNGKSIEVEAISAIQQTDIYGSSSIILGGNVKVSEGLAYNAESAALAVTVNYN